MTSSMRGMVSHRLRRSLLAMAAIALLTALPARADEFPNDEQQLRALLSQLARTGDLNTMSRLLRWGMDVNLQDKDGQPALVTAILAGQDDMVILLLGHKADVFARTKKGMTALHAAAYVGDLTAISALIAHGANVNDQANIAGITPLHAAAEEDHLAVVKRLVAAGADPKRVEVNGYTAGSRAGWREHWEIVRFLLRSGDTCQPEDLAGAWLRDKCTHLDVNASN
jgi:ankyrin repeat protein